MTTSVAVINACSGFSFSRIRLISFVSLLVILASPLCFDLFYKKNQNPSALEQILTIKLLKSNAQF
jgi:hypothetical protein